MWCSGFRGGKSLFLSVFVCLVVSLFRRVFENKLDSPFLQVELKQGGEKILLDKGLSDFYFNGNKILDEIFLKWFLDYYNYGVKLQEEYTIKIMDNDINFFDIIQRLL